MNKNQAANLAFWLDRFARGADLHDKQKACAVITLWFNKRWTGTQHNPEKVPTVEVREMIGVYNCERCLALGFFVQAGEHWISRTWKTPNKVQWHKAREGDGRVRHELIRGNRVVGYVLIEGGAGNADRCTFGIYINHESKASAEGLKNAKARLLKLLE